MSDGGGGVPPPYGYREEEAGVVLFVWTSVGWGEEGYGLQDEGGEVGGVAEDHFPDGAGGVGYEYYRE